MLFAIFFEADMVEAGNVLLKKLCNPGICFFTWLSKSLVAASADSTNRCNLGKCDFVDPLLAIKQDVHIS